MKKIFISFVLLFVTFSVYAVSKPAQSLNSVVAIVNKAVITQTELNEQVDLIKARYQGSKAELPPENILEQQVLQQLINKDIQLQLAHQMGIRATAQQITQAISRIAKGNQKTVKAFYQSLEKQGWTVKSFRKEIADQLMIQQLQMQQVAPHVTVTEAEVNHYLKTMLKNVKDQKSYHIADILIAVPVNPNAAQIKEAKVKAQALFAKLQQGANFQKMAMSHSKSDSALKGGDLGWDPLAQMPLDLAKAVKDLKVGQIAGPIEMPNGFHIVKLLGTKKLQAPKSVLQVQLESVTVHSKNGKTIAFNIEKTLKSGKSFSDLAQKYEEDQSVIFEEGGWMAISHFDSNVQKALLHLNPGDTTRPVETKTGWFLAKLIAKREGVETSKERKREIEQLIFQRKVQQRIGLFIQELRSQAYVKVML